MRKSNLPGPKPSLGMAEVFVVYGEVSLWL